MTDFPVLIPTSEGAVGGVVSDPGGDPRAAVVLLAGYGRPARSGVHSFWARLARELGELGLIALRIDYCREGETLPIGQGGSGILWKRRLDLGLVEQAVRWFRAQLGGTPLLLAGSCSGARLAIEIAGGDPDAVAGTLLVVPFIRDLEAVERVQSAGGSATEIAEADAVDPLVVECFRRMLAVGPSWILVGEEDDPDLPRLERLLGSASRKLEVEVSMGCALHELDQPLLQEEVRARLLSRLEQTIGAARGSIAQ